MFEQYETIMDTLFQREKLEELKRKYNVTMDKIIHEVYGRKQYKNWKVKISRLINKKQSDPHNFGLLELSEMLTNYFNKKRVNGDPMLSVTHFLGKTTYIPCIGEFLDSGRIRLFKKSEIQKVKVDSQYVHHTAVRIRQQFLQGAIRIFKNQNQITDGANYSLAVCEQKKTKDYYWGYLEPQANGKYNVSDISTISGKKSNTIATDIDLTSSSKICTVLYPKESDWKKE